MTAPDPRLGEIEARANNPFRTSMDGIAQLDEDRDYLLAELRKAQDALGRVLEWCDTNQHPFHPSEGAEGFSSQDWALDDAARRIRTAVADATGGGDAHD